MSFTVAFPRHQFVLIQFTSLLYSIWNLLPRRVNVRLTFAYKRNYPNPSRSYTLTCTESKGNWEKSRIKITMFSFVSYLRRYLNFLLIQYKMDLRCAAYFCLCFLFHKARYLFQSHVIKDVDTDCGSNTLSNREY